MSCRLPALLLAAACATAPGSQTSPTAIPTPEPGATAATEPGQAAPSAQAVPRIDDPQRLADFLPRRISGQNPIGWHPDRPSPSGTWMIGDRTASVRLSEIADLPALTTPMELLGLPAQAVLDGHEVRGLKVQGHRAQLTRQLEPPHRARLDVIAAETFHVEITVEPSQTLDDPLAIAEQLALGSMIRLALREPDPSLGDPASPNHASKESP